MHASTLLSLPAWRALGLRLWTSCAIVALALLLASCGGSSGSSPTPAARADITLLVYLLGSDLESGNAFGTKNIAEMQGIAPSDRVNVILTTGGSNKDGWRTVQRKRVRGEQVELLDDLGALDMGNQQTLQDFLTWGMQTYPADRTLLVMWNHGGGPNRGIGADENTEQSLSLHAIRSAVATATQQSGRTFALIGFDACLMASLEVAQALAPYADYMVASQELEPGSGQDWAALLTHLTSQPKDSTEAYGRTIVDAFIAKQLKENPIAQATLSLVDLREVGGVSDALAGIGATLDRQLIDTPVQTWLDIAQARATAFIFGTETLGPRPMELVDLNMFQWGSLTLADGQRERLATALQKAVIYEKHTEAFSNLTGLTFYLPQRVAETGADTRTYDTLTFVPAAWRQFIQRHSAVGTDDTRLPLPTVGAIDWGGESPYAPGRIEAPLSALSRALVAQDVSLVEDASGRVRLVKPLSGGTENSLVDPAFMQDWFQIGDADTGTPVYFSALPDGMRFAIDDPEAFLLPVELRRLDAAQRRSDDDEDDDDDEPDLGLLAVSNNNPEGVLRIVGFMSDNSNPSAGAPRMVGIPVGAAVRPLWLNIGADRSATWSAPPEEAGIPAVPLSTDTVIGRGALDRLPLGAKARIGVIDVRGWVQLDGSTP